MLQQIIAHTPLYVWALLAFLVYRGVNASADREVTLRNLFLIPGAMVYLSLQDLIGKFGVDGMTLVYWASGAAVSLAWTWNSIDASRITANRQLGTVLVRGSWAPLATMLLTFCSKYAIAIVSAIHPNLLQDSGFMIGVCLLFGLFNGIFFGRLLRHLMVYLQQPAAQQA